MRKPFELILMSDGLARLHEVYNLKTPQEIMNQALKEKSLEKLVSELRDYENKNTVIRVKQKDDASALLLTFSP